WVSHYPISNYLVSIAVGDYTRYNATSYVRPAPLATLYGPLTMPLDHLVYNDGSNALPFGFTQTADMISVFEEWFGPYGFASEKYGHSECTFGGGMEHQTMTSLGGSSISLVSHELCHQWYGDTITTRTWPHLWLNEGFATYGALLYFQQRSNLYPGTYETNLGTTMNSALNAVGTLVLEDTTSVSNMFASSRVYNKGAMVLYMLRWMVGDTVFKNIMQAYASDPALRYGCAVTSDFKRVCEQVSGLDLDTFFAQWVETGTGYPMYTACSFWQPVIDGWRVRVTLHQIQDSSISNVNVFVMPVEIVVHTASGDISHIALNNQRDQNIDFTVASQPTSVEVDPGKHILRADPINMGPCSTTGAGPLPIRTDIVQVYPNPASHEFSVHYSLATEGKVELGVYDVAGRRVMQKTIARAMPGEASEHFDASALPAGVYFVRMRPARGEAITRKIVLVR
ncbi:MAG TPA: M1 family aminopeptidase, partial [Candidatus Krumholzibacteria bacterium]